MSGLQRKIIVFVIALTFWGNVYAITNASNQTESNNTLACSVRHVEYRNAGEAAYKLFDDLVINTVYNSTLDNKPYMNKFNQSLNQFLKDSFTYCTNATAAEGNFKDYLKAVAFSISNVTVLRDLDKDGTFKCILKQKTNITQCVIDEVNKNITLHTNYSRLHAKSALTFNSVSCYDTKKVRSCALKVIDDNCNKATEYVKSLFDFLLNNYCIEMPETNASVKLIGHWSVFIVVGLWNALAL